MKRSVLTSLVSLSLAGASAQAAVTLLDKDGWKAQLGGFAELDIFHDSTRSFTESTNNSPVAKSGTYNGDNGRTQMSVADSRLAFAVMPPANEGWQAKGYIEGDFLGANAGTTESKYYTSPVFRIRHAYLADENSCWQLLAGQTWSLLGWQTYYLQPSIAVPAAVGALYERTPQVTAMNKKKLGSLALQSALSLERPAQRDSGYPNVNGGLRFSFDGWRGALANSPAGDVGVAPASAAITGSARDFKLSGGSHQTGYAVAVDAFLPILRAAENDPGNSLVLLGEFSTGRGYGELFPGYSGGLAAQTSANDFNIDPGLAGNDGTGFRLVDLQSYNVTLQYHLPSELQTWVNVGFARLKSDNIGAMGTPGAIYTSNEFYFANIYHDVTRQIRVATEYSYAKTDYNDGSSGHNNRYQVSFWYRF